MARGVATGVVIEGSYEVVGERSARGAFKVFDGRDVRRNTPVEIRTISANADHDLSLQFSREAQILTRVDHPGCLHGHSAASMPDGSMYLVVQPVGKNRLSDRQGSRLPPYHVADIGAQILRAVEHLREQGWSVGALSPAHVEEEIEGDRIVVRIVDFPNTGEIGQTVRVRPQDAAYADIDVLAGRPNSQHSDLFSVGMILRQLASGTSAHQASLSSSRLVVDRETGSGGLDELIEHLTARDKSDRYISAHEAACAFEDWCRTVAAEEGIPRPKPVDSPVSAQSSSFWPEDTGVTMDGTFDTPGPIAQTGYDRPPRSRRRLAVPAALGALAVAGGVALFVGHDGGSSTPPPDQASVEVASLGPDGAPAAVANPVEGASMQPANRAGSDPVQWISTVNRTDLDAVVGYVERHELLHKLSGRPELQPRVNTRWNRLLDLLQASDADRPCSVFREAMPVLDEKDPSEDERRLIAKVVVPTPSKVRGAGEAPDGTCEGLATEFDAKVQALTKDEASPAQPSLRRRSPTPDRRRDVEPAAAAPELPPPPPVPPAEANPSKKKTNKTHGSVAEALSDDIKGLRF